MFQINEIRSLTQLLDWEDDWRDLSARTPHASPFLSFDWYQTLLSSHAHSLIPHALAVSLLGKPLGIIPLTRHLTTAQLTHIPTLWPTPLTVVGPNIAATLCGGIKHLAAHRDWTSLTLSPIDTAHSDLGRTANAFKLASLSPSISIAARWPQIDLTTFSDPHSRLRTQLDQHLDHLHHTPDSDHQFLRVRPESSPAHLLRIQRLLPAQSWLADRIVPLTSVISWLNQSAQLDLSVIVSDNTIHSLYLATTSPQKVLGGLLLTNPITPQKTSSHIAELVRSSLDSDLSHLTLAGFPDPLILPWAQRIVHAQEYLAYSKFSWQGWTTRIKSATHRLTAFQPPLQTLQFPHTSAPTPTPRHSHILRLHQPVS